MTMVKQLKWQSADKSVKIKLVYLSKPTLKIYPMGRSYDKAYPIVTQCLIFKNGLLESFGEVTKHHDDENDINLAARNATKKAISAIGNAWTRRDIWKMVLAEFPCN